jgi:hypothetical protein
VTLQSQDTDFQVSTDHIDAPEDYTAYQGLFPLSPSREIIRLRNHAFQARTASPDQVHHMEPGLFQWDDMDQPQKILELFALQDFSAVL